MAGVSRVRDPTQGSIYLSILGGSGWSEHSNEVTIQSVTVYLLVIKVQANFIPFLHQTKHTI